MPITYDTTTDEVEALALKSMMKATRDLAPLIKGNDLSGETIFSLITTGKENGQTLEEVVDSVLSDIGIDDKSVLLRTTVKRSLGQWYHRREAPPPYIPKAEFHCAITLALMTDPVTRVADNIVYERSSFLSFFPAGEQFTNLPSLKDQIADWRKNHEEAWKAAGSPDWQTYQRSTTGKFFFFFFCCFFK